eukprot:jgi/Tetstr1/442883/TSEL_030946.t1
MLSGDWAARRVARFVVKRQLGRLLATELDPAQLDVGLAAGELELREVLLDCAELNAQLGLAGWDVTSAYVGTVGITVPYASLHTDSCRVTVSEVLITVAPSEGGPAAAAAAPAQDGAASTAEAMGDAMGGLLSDGVQMLAGGIQQVLRRLQVEARDVRVRLEMPGADGGAGGAGVAMLRAARLAYADEGDPEGEVGEVAKRATVEGLRLELLPPEAEAPGGGGRGGRPAEGEAEGEGEGEAEGEARLQEGDGWEGGELEVPAGCAPLLDGPAGGGVAASVLLRVGADASLELRVSIGPAEVQVKPAQVPLLCAIARLGGAPHLARGAASLYFPASPGPPGLRLRLEAERLALVVALGDAAPVEPGGPPPAGQLVVEATRVEAGLERGWTLAAAAGGGTEMSLRVWGLEAGERLPLEHPHAAGPAGGLEAFGRLPASLPAGPWPTPAFAGLYTPDAAAAGEGALGRSALYASCLAASNLAGPGGGLAGSASFHSAADTGASGLSMASSFMADGTAAPHFA